MDNSDSPQLRYRSILEHIESARSASKLAAAAVALVAVSKSQPVERILPLLEVGHRVFGENKVQEAQAKWPDLRRRYGDIELHLIGSLQSNKAQEAIELFDIIQTVDRTSLVDALVKARSKTNGRCKEFWVQVNIGAEPQKGGVPIEELPTLLAYCQDKSLPINGLMCVPPAEDDPVLYFALLHKLAKRNGLAHLSMGMSGDFEHAVRLGATHVRVGTALFGDRA